MNLLGILQICLPIFFLIMFFFGIVKKNKRLWITSLIFLVVITLAELAYFTPVKGVQSEIELESPIDK